MAGRTGGLAGPVLVACGITLAGTAHAYRYTISPPIAKGETPPVAAAPLRKEEARVKEETAKVYSERIFVEGRAERGLPDFEAAEAGAVWRFHNEGNRASFVAHPEIYGPQFGGYDPVDLGRGVPYAGNPRFWVVAGDRLYLFGREENRDAFAADPQHFLKDARARWPAIEQNLAQ